MRTYHYSVRIGRGKTTFPTVALGSLRGSLAFFWKGRGVQSPWLAISQTYLSALFSCQRAVAKACCFHVKAGQSRKEGDIKPCSAKNCFLVKIRPVFQGRICYWLFCCCAFSFSINPLKHKL